jgi:RnfABCDGE-type electron transport complex G subunit
MIDKIKMLAFVLICGTLLSTALVFVDKYTSPIIAKNESLKLKRNVMTAFSIPYSEADLEATFAAKVKVERAADLEFYRNEANDAAMAFSGGGLWGPITGIAALSPGLDRIRDLTIMHQEETPGLGSRIAERSHLDKFKDKKILPALVSVPSGKAKAETEVDAITGATLSSNALVEVLNKSLSESLAALKGATK